MWECLKYILKQVNPRINLIQAVITFFVNCLTCIEQLLFLFRLLFLNYCNLSSWTFPFLKHKFCCWIRLCVVFINSLLFVHKQNGRCCFFKKKHFMLLSQSSIIIKLLLKLNFYCWMRLFSSCIVLRNFLLCIYNTVLLL